VLKPGGDEHLTLESLRAMLGSQLWRKQFDDHFAVERTLGREKEATHPTRRELALYEVGVAKSSLEPFL
jgi:hypothetical protein